ncbi:MAG: hypothetical protein JO056_03135 [Alphaproteobacteria bacterium]|nr:hypothetical protein [Alphaproteobacteria bacterium]
MSFRKHLMAASAAVAAFGLAASADAGTAKHYHIFRATSFESLAKQAPPPAGDMNYYGGKVFSHVIVQSVMWNKDVVQNTQDQIPLFSAAIVDSTYTDQMKEYSTKGVKSISGHKGTKQTISRGTYIGQVVLKPHNTSLNLTDEDIQAELARQIDEGKLAPRSIDTLYMVYFPSNIHIDLQGSQSCVAFGAYHFATNDKKTDKKHNIWYSVEPECNSGFTFLTFAASHEFAEAVTDNVPTPGSNPDFPQAWNDAQGFEVGDKCSGSGTLTSDSGSWRVTQYYLNSLHGCSTTSTYKSP